MIHLVDKKSEIDLMCSMIDIHQGDWVEHVASIGAGSDSFYEYLYKAYILLADNSLHGSFMSVYTSIEGRINKDDYYFPVDCRSGKQLSQIVDSLSAFWPGLQVITGNIDDAIDSHIRYTDIIYQYVSFSSFIVHFCILRLTFNDIML